MRLSGIFIAVTAVLGLLPLPNGKAQTVTNIAAGDYHSLFFKSDGSLWAMGYDYDGQLGDGASGYGLQTNRPERIASGNIAAMAAGTECSLFVMSNGGLWGMGDNIFGQLGDGTYNNTNKPELVETGNVTAVTTGGYHSLFIKSDGSLWGMGYNGSGELGDGSYNYVGVSSPELIVSNNVTAIAAGGSDSLFLKSDGSLWAMGYNGSGQLGDGTATTEGTNQPELIVSNNVTAVAAGGGHNLFLKSDGSLWGMGNNNYGQLGDGTYNNTNAPELIVSNNVAAVAAGFFHSLFLKNDGSLWAMGYNSSGQLGDGTYSNVNQPEMIVASNVTAIATGGYHSLFLKTDGSLWGMGGNANGQLGDGGYYDRNTPEQILPLANPFTPGDIAVLRVQAVSGVLTNVNAALFLDEFVPAGLLVQTIAIATNGANALMSSGFSVAEDSLTLTPNGRWLCFGAYRAPVGVTNVTTSSSAQYPRVLATVDIFGNVKIAASSASFYNANNIRGAVSDGTNNFWGVGSGGLDYYGFNAAANGVNSVILRAANFINGALYYTTTSSGGIYKFAALPKSATTASLLISETASPYGFAISPAGNIAYIADDSQSSAGGLVRYTNAAGIWSHVYTLGTGIANTGARGLTVDWSGVSPVLYASTSENSIYGNPNNRVIRIVDKGVGSTAVTLAKAASNSSFRGVAFVPSAIGAQSQIQGVIPENSNLRLYWRGLGGNNYVVQASTNLSLNSSFNDTTKTISLPGSGVVATNYLDAGALTNLPSRFYRIRSTP